MPRPRSRCSRVAGVITGLIAVVTGSSPAAAQRAEKDEDAVCYRFAFGPWSPALDRAAAGHDPGAQGGPGAPGGRDWAVPDYGGGAALMLFPAWWPAGVSIRLAMSPPSAGDTVSGTATALVADGHRRAPSAPIRVWGVPCAGPVAQLPRPGASP